MKQLLTIIFAGCLFFSCSKAGNDNIEQQLISGKWELSKATGGIAGLIEYPPGNGNFFQFNGDHTFRSFRAAVQDNSGTYEVRLLDRAAPNQWTLVLHYNINGQNQSFSSNCSFEKNQLIFLAAETCCDMQTIYYNHILM